MEFRLIDEKESIPNYLSYRAFVIFMSNSYFEYVNQKRLKRLNRFIKNKEYQNPKYPVSFFMDEFRFYFYFDESFLGY